jgi:hypothetical protein
MWWGSLRGAAISGLSIIWIQFLTKGLELMTMLNAIKFMLQLVNPKSAVDVADS